MKLVRVYGQTFLEMVKGIPQTPIVVDEDADLSVGNIQVAADGTKFVEMEPMASSHNKKVHLTADELRQLADLVDNETEPWNRN